MSSVKRIQHGINATAICVFEKLRGPLEAVRIVHALATHFKQFRSFLFRACCCVYLESVVF
jgi:hypothetical protein